MISTSRPRPRVSKSDGTLRVCAAMLLLSILALSGGCSRAVLGEREYGKRFGMTGGRSVNGTSVFADMFTSAGCRVRNTTSLGRTVDRADVVVWFPNRFTPPEKKTRQHLESWLQYDSNRTLIYVGRDFDAEIVYWNSVIGSAPPDQRIELRKRLAKARARYARVRTGFDPEEDCEWFKVDRTQSPRTIDSVSGKWSTGLDPTQADMRLLTRYEVSDSIKDENEDWRGSAEMRQLLASDGDMLVGEFSRTSWSNSRLIVVTNGSWLLNAPLVNKEHRKLAARIIRSCGAAKKVVFLESGPADPRVSHSGPNQHHGLEAFTVWPLNCMLMHLAGLGLVVCYALFPIFGRPRELDDEKISDFGKHIRALGSLLSRTHDREFAHERRKYYQQRVLRETPDSPPNQGTVTNDINVVEAVMVPTETETNDTEALPQTSPSEKPEN